MTILGLVVLEEMSEVEVGPRLNNDLDFDTQKTHKKR